MINVIAMFQIKPGKRTEFLEIFKPVVSEVKKESGCIEYFPAVDIDSKLSLQSKDENVVVVIEKWENLEALRKHTSTQLMANFIEKIKNITENVTVKILEHAS